MQARLATYRIDPDRCTDALSAFGQAGEEIAQLDGFIGGYLLVDGDAGDVVTLTLWDSGAAVDRSNVRASGARQRAVDSVGGEVVSVRRFSVARPLGLGVAAAATGPRTAAT